MTKRGIGLGAGVSNPEALLRMNFLSQAAMLMANTECSDGSTFELNRFYMRTLHDVSQKLVIRRYDLEYMMIDWH